MRRIRSYTATAILCATQAFDGGFLAILGKYLIRLVTLLAQLGIWRVLLSRTSAEMSLEQVLTYSCVSSVFAEQLNVVSPASLSFWEGTLANRYTRPLPVVGQLVAETFGRWLPGLALYSLPTLIAAAALGFPLAPASLPNFFLFLVSISLAVSLGFAIDFAFTSFSVRFRNMGWTALAIRSAFFVICSGALIPFELLPWGIGEVFRILPFGSLAHSPLSIYVGSSDPLAVILGQAAWNLALWPLCLVAFRRSEERMVAYGG